MISTLAKTNIGEVFSLREGKTIENTFGADTGIRGYIGSILPTFITIAGLILLFLIIGGGISMITTAGNPEAQQKSKDTVKHALIGFIIVFMSFWIIQIIQKLTGVNILSN